MAHEQTKEFYSDEVNLDLAGAEHVHAVLQMGAGNLQLQGGSEGLLEGRLEYGVPAWKPEVAYRVDSGRGHLEVRQPDLLKGASGRPHYRWALALTEAVPLDLAVRLGAGRTRLMSSPAKLRLLEAALGSGEFVGDLSGDLPELTDVSLKMGSGRIELLLNGNYPALDKVGIATASGVADLALGGRYDTLERLNVRGASGDLRVALTGSFPALEDLTFEVASGTVDLKIGEALARTAAVRIRSVAGVASIDYPAGMGVAVRFTSVTGKLDAPDFRRDQGRYVNAAYGESAACLELSFSTVSGKLVLQPQEH